ncbi:forkhead associated domain (FHA) containing [Cryptosporidium sp. chipmunk genotype I]|uniref:forkhead associated domain (FHA) containing n=1 Tax=Cryptosporidium sp. chipmunk genotype I TaxID=1280935 RepID=UPI00351A1452|nr:forkhead associated domain (FHA) containing [Cryptosporidium sp. chipmunk genotype I]
MRGFISEEGDEFYSDSVECSEFEDSVEIVRSQSVGSEEFEEDGIEMDDNEYEILNSHKRFRKIESSQESYTQNSNFNYLNNEIKDINSKIESISSNIENIITNSGNVTNPVCILEYIPTNNKNLGKKILFQVGNSGLKIGRNSDCDFPGKIVPNKDLLKLSRNHAYIYVKKNSQGKDQIYLVDCNSVNGTYVNNIKIKSQILNSNDVLSFGNKDEDNNTGFKPEFSKKKQGISDISTSGNHCKFKVILFNN